MRECGLEGRAYNFERDREEPGQHQKMNIICQAHFFSNSAGNGDGSHGESSHVGPSVMNIMDVQRFSESRFREYIPSKP